MNFSKEQVAQILSSLGYEVNHSWQFKLRTTERTSSASINPKNGKIKDFGDGFYGSIIDVLTTFHNYNVKDAFQYVEKQLALPCTFDFSKYDKKETEYKTGFIPEEYISSFKKDRLENFPEFWKKICLTLPALSNEMRKKVVEKFDIGFCSHSKRLIMPLRDDEGRIMTLWKYDPTPEPYVDKKTGEVLKPKKVKFTKNRKRCPFNLRDLIKFRENLNEYILIMEGEKDCLNAIGSDLRAVTLGSATAQVPNEYLYLFKDTKILICYDYDEAGVKGINILSEQLKDICSDIKILDWERKIKKLGKNFKLFKGFDFTDYLSLKKGI